MQGYPPHFFGKIFRTSSGGPLLLYAIYEFWWPFIFTTFSKTLDIIYILTVSYVEILTKESVMLNRGDNNLGQVQINKGRLTEDLPLIAWDAVENCSGELCNLYNVCPYQKIGKCELQMKYLTNVHNTLAPALAEADDPMKVLRPDTAQS